MVDSKKTWRLVEVRERQAIEEENGFKNGYMNKLEELIKYMFPNCGLKATPHIESRIKHWSEKYVQWRLCYPSQELDGMLRRRCYKWRRRCSTNRVIKKEKGLFAVPFTHFDTLAEIYVKDKTTRDASESFVDDVNSAHSASYSSTSQSGKRPMKLEDHSTPSKMAKVKARSLASDSSTQFRSIKIEDNHPSHSKKEKVKDVKEAKVKGKNLKSLYKNDDDELVASLHDVSKYFGKIFENINDNLGTIASACSNAEEREQRMDEKVNKVLEEVMKLDGISPSEALEVATILMAEEHKH
ncbi:Structural maintenance of chromosomes flexible hinge domain-containing protein 1 [Bienertia sinuspersici]